MFIAFCFYTILSDITYGSFRFILAETLGFQNYAQKALATTMAGKVETAVWMLEK